MSGNFSLTLFILNRFSTSSISQIYFVGSHSQSAPKSISHRYKIHLIVQTRVWLGQMCVPKLLAMSFTIWQIVFLTLRQINLLLGWLQIFTLLCILQNYQLPRSRIRQYQPNTYRSFRQLMRSQRVSCDILYKSVSEQYQAISFDAELRQLGLITIISDSSRCRKERIFLDFRPLAWRSIAKSGEAITFSIQFGLFLIIAKDTQSKGRVLQNIQKTCIPNDHMSAFQLQFLEANYGERPSLFPMLFVRELFSDEMIRDSPRSVSLNSPFLIKIFSGLISLCTMLRFYSYFSALSISNSITMIKLYLWTQFGSFLNAVSAFQVQSSNKILIAQLFWKY